MGSVPHGKGNLEGGLEMKNVLIISASPRKNGNSDILCDRFAEGAKESGNKAAESVTIPTNA